MSSGRVLHKIYQGSGCPGAALAVIAEDFDPATHEVLVVAKDARRVWIEECNVDGQWLHSGSQPKPELPPLRPWHSTSDAMQVLSDAALSGLRDGDLVEFVAIATHRPPELEKSVEASEDYEPIPASIQAEVSEIMRAAGIPVGCSKETVAAPVPSL